MKPIEALQSRFSCKEFDEEKPINDKDIEEIIEAFRLSPSMLNIQPWKLFIIKNQDIKNQLKPYSFEQNQITQCSHLLVFTRKKTFDTTHIQNIVKGMENAQNIHHTIQNFLKQKNEIELEHWASMQVAVALGNLVCFLSNKQIDACPIGLLNTKKYDEILLPHIDGFATVYAMALGYHKQKPTSKMPRLPVEDISQIIV